MLKNVCQVKVKNKNHCMHPFYNNLDINGIIKNVCKRHHNDYNIRKKQLNFIDNMEDNYIKNELFVLQGIDYIQIIKNSILQYIQYYYKDLEVFIDIINEECSCNQVYDDNKKFKFYIQCCIFNIFDIIKKCLKTHEDIHDCDIFFNNNFTVCQFIFAFKDKNKYCQPTMAHLYRIKEKKYLYFCIHIQYLTIFSNHIDFIQRIRIIIN